MRIRACGTGWMDRKTCRQKCRRHDGFINGIYTVDMAGAPLPLSAVGTNTIRSHGIIFNVS
jgi:hypothetical protein